MSLKAINSNKSLNIIIFLSARLLNKNLNCVKPILVLKTIFAKMIVRNFSQRVPLFPDALSSHGKRVK